MFNDRCIDFPLQLILKHARAAKSRIGLEWTRADNSPASGRDNPLLRLPAVRDNQLSVSNNWMLSTNAEYPTKLAAQISYRGAFQWKTKHRSRWF